MKRSATWADVGAAKRSGVKSAIILCITVLQDKCGFDKEEVIDFLTNVTKLSEEIEEGRVCVKDLESVLIEEYGMSVWGQVK